MVASSFLLIGVCLFSPQGEFKNVSTGVDLVATSEKISLEGKRFKISNNGAVVVGITPNSELLRWDAAKKKQQSFKIEKERLETIEAIRDDGRLVAIGLTVWDSSNGKKIGTFDDSEFYLGSGKKALLFDGKTTLRLMSDNGAVDWNLKTKKTSNVIPFKDTEFAAFAAFQPDAKKILKLSTDNVWFVADSRRTVKQQRWMQNEGMQMQVADISGNGEYAFIRSFKARKPVPLSIYRLDLKSGKRTLISKITEMFDMVEVKTNFTGDRLVQTLLRFRGNPVEKTEVLDLSNPDAPKTIATIPPTPFVSFSKNGKILGGYFQDGKIRLYKFK